MKNLVQPAPLVIPGSLASDYARLVRLFESEAPEGVTRIGGRLEGDGPHALPDPKVKYRVWLLDSMLWTIEELAAGRAVYALRGLVQVSGYRGILDGLGARNYATDDAFTAIKNYIESIVEKGERS